MAAFQRILNALFIFVLCGVLLAAYSYQVIKSEDPCPLCLLQRLGMIGIATALLLNLRFGIKMEHYGLGILSALLGRIVSLRQISLHVCPAFPTFGEPVFGYDLYVWAFIVFTFAIFSIAILLMISGFTKNHEVHPRWGILEKTAFGLVALITLGNTITTFLECGLSPCQG
ncbi:MAG: disulfide bond formation protein B [Chlamydiota bacterium]